MPKSGYNKRKTGRKVRKAVRRQQNSEFAYVCDTLKIDYQCNNNTSYTMGNFSLTNSTRAKSVAQAYQFYRISKVELEFKPQADTFIGLNNNTGSQVSVPYLYYLINKSLSLPPNWSIGMLRAAGAKPRRLDDKSIKVAFKPVVYLGSTDSPQNGALVADLAAAIKTSPWLPCNGNAGNNGDGTVWTPNSVDHHGVSFYIEQTNQTAGMIPALLTVRIHYQFKKPVWPTPAAGDDLHTTIIDVDTLNGEIIQV